ncbi:hypothetical protein PUN28_009317 [Cardiocondyla obscurior]
MEQRLSNSSRPQHQPPPSHSKKSKRRSGRRSGNLQNLLDTWPQNAPQNDQDSGLVAGMEYPQQMLWQTTSVPQNVPGNGQRLFTAMSDPSVCGYSPMPMTYTMQPVSLPAMYRMYQPMPMPNIRTVHNKQRHHYNKHLTNIRPGGNNNVSNGYESLQQNGVLESPVHIDLQNGDYTSLPPTANKDSGVNSDELNSEHRRYSDPGLGPAGNSDHSDNDDSDSVESGSSVTTISRSNKLVLSLIEQMTELKKCNSQLFKELSETKSNLENVKAKLAQCKHNIPTDYQPGMLSELIREIREANRNCEENLITKVKSMLDERCNQQTKEVDEMKTQLANLMKEKEESDQHVAKLEEEVTGLKLSVTNEGREIAVFEEENLALRRELQEARASRTQAENHAAKCVNFAVSRSVTPVTFDTPCITSTPVRTALTDRFPSPAIPPASHTSFVSSVLSSAEVAASRPVSEGNKCLTFGTDSEFAPYVDSPAKKNAPKRADIILASCSTSVTRTNNDAVDIWNEIAKRESEVIDAERICDILSQIDLGDLEVHVKGMRGAMRNDGKIKSTDEEKKTKVLLSGILEESIDDQLLGIYEAKMLSVTEKDGANDLVSFGVPGEQKDLLNKLNDVPCRAEKLINNSNNNSFWQKLCKLRGNQRASFKKSRRKKGASRRSTDELEEDSCVVKFLAEMAPSCASASDRDVPNEDGDRFPNGDHSSRAITDVPDVVVISGGPVVPKDLCSMRTLTSRTQTAPSRATYTTAYI